MDHLTSSCTVEDIITFKKKDIQQYLRVNNQKITGSKLEIATRACDHVHLRLQLDLSVASPVNVMQVDTTSREETLSGLSSTIPEIKELNSGWTSDRFNFPTVSHKDVENYLINSKHTTIDRNKMECYRQYIRGFNFFKEKYIHKVMLNLISEDSYYCYIRSKCFPSMKQGVYTQWILVSKRAPFFVTKANCTCAAGLGEGCTHIAGLLFALENITETEEGNNEVDTPACTSKPCEWNKPSKRNKTCKTVDKITFKRIKYDSDGEDKCKKDKSQVKVKSNGDNSLNFRDVLCAKLVTTRAAIFDLLEPQPNTNTDENICDDLNVGRTEIVETSEHITFPSDRYLDLGNTIDKEFLSPESFLDFVTNIPSSVAEELEVRTRGQAENDLWKKARKVRITASIFHDIKTRKPNTPATNLVKKILNVTEQDLEMPALKWGRKMEPIAKKRYKAFKKLKFNQNVTVMEKGLYISSTCGYLGASPDGLVKNGDEFYLIEVKCPYKYRFQTVDDACKDKSFCCFLDENNNVQLKQSHKYFTQIQGQMAICQVHKCELVVYTNKDMKIIEISYDSSFWEDLFKKLKGFYELSVVSSLFAKE